MQDVESFAAEFQLQELLPLLRKGALAAQSPESVEDIAELDASEKEALRNEVLHRWRQPKILYFTIILNSIAAAIQGWDQTGSNGANLSWPDEFGLPQQGPICNTAGVNCDDNQWLVGLVNSMPYFAIFML